MTRYRICHIGCSPTRGRDHLRAFARNADRFEIAAICDLDHGRLAALGDEFGVAARYTDAEAMLAEQRPEVLCFVTLPAIRRQLVELGIRHGVRAIAYEKPMATDWPEAVAMQRALRDASVRSIQSHQHKYGPHWCRARAIIATGDIGEVRHVHASAKGWLLHYVSHLLDYSMFLTGRERVAWVAAHAHGRDRLDDNHPSPDYLFARYAFADGLPGCLECGTLAPSLPGGSSFWMDAGVRVEGSEGWLQVVAGSGLWGQTRTSSGVFHEPAAFDADEDQPRYIRELADWLDDEGHGHACDGERAFHGFEVAMAACWSAATRLRVDLPLAEDLTPMARLLAELPDCPPPPGAAVRP